MDRTISQLINKLDTAHLRNTALQFNNNELKDLFILKDLELNDCTLELDTAKAEFYKANMNFLEFLRIYVLSFFCTRPK